MHKGYVATRFRKEAAVEGDDEMMKNTLSSSNELERVACQEAGHAVATLAFEVGAGAIVFRCVENNGVRELGGTYQVPFGFQIIPGGGPPDYSSLEIRAAAGRVAEELRFGNYGPGVAGDMGKINRFINFAGHSAAERDAGFPSTSHLLEQQWDVVTRLATICHRKAVMMNLPDTFPNTQILSDAAVQRICSDPTISDEERGRVLEAAYHRALLRGQGSIPAFNQEDCGRDFIEAAGDFLANI